MVNIINIGFGIYQLNEIGNDPYYIFSCKDPDIHFCLESEFFVDPVTADFTQVISLV